MKDGKVSTGLAARLQRISSAAALDASAYSEIPSRRERDHRTPTYKTAGLNLGAGERVAVVVKNLSEKGARLEFFQKHVLPETIWLSEPSLPLQTWARVIWQEDGAAGVVFLDS